jgi:hypothetical protein
MAVAYIMSGGDIKCNRIYNKLVEIKTGTPPHILRIGLYYYYYRKKKYSRSRKCILRILLILCTEKFEEKDCVDRGIHER